MNQLQPPQNKDGKIFSNWWLPPQAVPTDMLRLVVRFYIKHSWPLTKKQKKHTKVLTSAFTSTHKHTHSLWPKSPLMFLWIWSVRGSVRVNCYYSPVECACLCVCACVPTQQRGRGSSCHILPLEAISFHTHMLHIQHHQHTHTLYSCSLTHTLAPTYTHTYCICIYVDYIWNWENQFFLMGFWDVSTLSLVFLHTCLSTWCWHTLSIHTQPKPQWDTHCTLGHMNI